MSIFLTAALRRAALVFAVVFLVSSLTANGQTTGTEGTCLLFSYFTENGEDGLHLAWSNDGLVWEALNGGKSLLKPMVGKDMLMRDPCIAAGPDSTFHMVWTVSWNDTTVGYASSRDLITWSEQRAIPVMAHEPTARNCWAPEIAYDDTHGGWMIFWSTTIPGRFDNPGSASEDGYDHRIYCTTTRDFTAFTPTKLLYNPGFNVIDGTILKSASVYLLFFKDERLTPPRKNIRWTSGWKIDGPYGPPSPPITGAYWAEGPTALMIGDAWYVYFDRYREERFGAVRSNDLQAWEDISDRVRFPEGARHGTVFEASTAALEKLKALQ
jgi:hypothetical protein